MPIMFSLKKLDREVSIEKIFNNFCNSIDSYCSLCVCVAVCRKGFGKIYLVRRDGGPNNGNLYAIKKVLRKDKSNILTELNVRAKTKYFTIKMFYKQIAGVAQFE